MCYFLQFCYCICNLTIFSLSVSYTVRKITEYHQEFWIILVDLHTLCTLRLWGLIFANNISASNLSQWWFKWTTRNRISTQEIQSQSSYRSAFCRWECEMLFPPRYVTNNFIASSHLLLKKHDVQILWHERVILLLVPR